jgi:hypothetical protein
MAFYVNLNYRFSLDDSICPNGSIVPCGAVTMHGLTRRARKGLPQHMQHLLFDPQLYMAGLDASESGEYCTKLATYLWFGVSGLQEYDSGEQTQSSWKQDAEQCIDELWPRVAPSDSRVVEAGVQECIGFQRQLGCEAMILPSPLTLDRSTDYHQETLWLDTAMDYIGYLDQARNEPFNFPVYATIALTDSCLRHSSPDNNPLLDLILDVVSARRIDGVYIVLEQGSETDFERQCGNTNALWSILHLVHTFVEDCNLRVIVNYLGPFGLACEAAGATVWGSGWYKSLYRCRLADKIAGGRAYPWYWSYSSAADISLDGEFDKLRGAGIIERIADVTSASEGLLQAAAQGVNVSQVPAWQYRMANVAAAQQHYLLSVIQAEHLHAQLTGAVRRDFVEAWLTEATQSGKDISDVLGSAAKTKTQHIQAWKDAFVSYRRAHRC